MVNAVAQNVGKKFRHCTISIEIEDDELKADDAVVKFT